MAIIDIFVLCVTSIEFCVVCDEYKYLVLSVTSLEIFVCSVTSIESSVVCHEYRTCVVCDEFIILCCLLRVQKSCVVSGDYRILCCL